MAKPRNIIIPVMGRTKAGKSSFINAAANLSERDKLRVGRDLVSCTKELEVIEAPRAQLSEYPSLVSGHQLLFVDTPGFDDTDTSDYNTLQLIASYLGESCRKGDILGGVLYLHDISRDDFMGSAKKNLQLFDQLCGEHSMFKVVLVTTKWERETPRDDYGAREKELQDVHWKGMIDFGATTMRLATEDHASAIKIVDKALERLVDPDNRARGLLFQVLHIQRELVAERKYLSQTNAAKLLLEQLEEMVEVQAALRRSAGQGGAYEEVKVQDEKLGKLEGEIKALRGTLIQRTATFLKRFRRF